MATLNSLAWFTVTGYVYDIEDPNPDTSATTPVLGTVSAYLDFFPGDQQSSFPAGYTVLVPNMNHGDGTSGDTMVPISPITGRLMNNQVCSIVVGDTPGVQLLANMAILELENPLFYHVRWRNVTFNQGTVQAISNFAFAAPTGTESPTNLAAMPSTTGGTLAAGAYTWGVTATQSWGETAPSNTVTQTLTSSTSSVPLTWDGSPGATGYNIYRSAAGFTTLTTLVAEVSSTTLSYIDIGSGTALTAPVNDIIDLTSPTLQTYEYGGP